MEKLDEIQSQGSEQKVTQTIYHGNVYEALYANFVTTDEILEHLLQSAEKTAEAPEHKPDKYSKEQMLRVLAYRAVCAFDKKQTIRGKSFIKLTNDKFYIAVHLLTIPNVTDKNILRKRQNVLPKLLHSEKFSHIVHVICDVILDRYKFIPADEAFAVAARSLLHLEKYQVKDNYVAFLVSDYLQPLKYLEWDEYEDELLNRCLNLRQQAPLYWEKVVATKYSVLVKKNIEQIYLTRKKIEQYNLCFPGLFPQEIVNKSNLYLRLRNCDEKVQAYLLGYPVHYYIPSAQILQKSLDQLEELGVEKYCETILPTLKFDTCGEASQNTITQINHENVNFDNLMLFSEFDKVKHYTNADGGIKVFIFTRQEFPKLLADKKNFYTGEFLPPHVLQEIICRNRIAEIYHLPCSHQLDELLNKISSGELFGEDDDSNSNEHEHEDDELPALEDDDELQESGEQEIPGQQEGRVLVGRARNQNGVIQTFSMRLPEDVATMNTNVLNNLISRLMRRNGLEYLGEVECECEDCDREDCDNFESVN